MRAVLAAALAGAVLAVAACGGGDSGSSGGETLTKAQYITRADRICKQLEEATRTYSEQVDALPAGADTTRIANILKSGLAKTRKGVERLKALKAPSEKRATLDAYFTSIDKAVVAYDGLVDAVSAKDEAKARRLARQIDPLFDDQRRLARQYGFQQCRSL